MRNYSTVLFGLTALLLLACQSDQPTDEVTEIRTGTSNADLVRNPISADTPLDSSKVAKITFAQTEFDFGSVEEGEIVEHQYKFTNTGTYPLIIQNARSSCGCTVPEWPKEPIAPGESNVITAKFNTKGRPGNQKKLIYISANTLPSETSVMLKGEVIGEEKVEEQ